MDSTLPLMSDTAGSDRFTGNVGSYYWQQGCLAQQRSQGHKHSLQQTGHTTASSSTPSAQSYEDEVAAREEAANYTRMYNRAYNAMMVQQHITGTTSSPRHLKRKASPTDISTPAGPITPEEAERAKRRRFSCPTPPAAKGSRSVLRTPTIHVDCYSDPSISHSSSANHPSRVPHVQHASCAAQLLPEFDRATTYPHSARSLRPSHDHLQPIPYAPHTAQQQTPLSPQPPLDDPAHCCSDFSSPDSARTLLAPAHDSNTSPSTGIWLPPDGDEWVPRSPSSMCLPDMPMLGEFEDVFAASSNRPGDFDTMAQELLDIPGITVGDAEPVPAPAPTTAIHPATQPATTRIPSPARGYNTSDCLEFLGPLNEDLLTACPEPDAWDHTLMRLEHLTEPSTECQQTELLKPASSPQRPEAPVPPLPQVSEQDDFDLSALFFTDTQDDDGQDILLQSHDVAPATGDWQDALPGQPMIAQPKATSLTAPDHPQHQNDDNGSPILLESQNAPPSMWQWQDASGQHPAVCQPQTTSLPAPAHFQQQDDEYLDFVLQSNDSAPATGEWQNALFEQPPTNQPKTTSHPAPAHPQQQQDDDDDCYLGFVLQNNDSAPATGDRQNALFEQPPIDQPKTTRRTAAAHPQQQDDDDDDVALVLQSNDSAPATGEWQNALFEQPPINQPKTTSHPAPAHPQQQDDDNNDVAFLLQSHDSAPATGEWQIALFEQPPKNQPQTTRNTAPPPPQHPSDEDIEPLIPAFAREAARLLQTYIHGHTDPDFDDQNASDASTSTHRARVTGMGNNLHGEALSLWTRTELPAQQCDTLPTGFHIVGSLAKDLPLPRAKRTKHQQAPARPQSAAEVDHNRPASAKNLNLRMECRLEIGSEGYDLMHRIGHLASEGLVMIAQGTTTAPPTTAQQAQETNMGIWALTAHHFQASEKPCLVLSEVPLPEDNRPLTLELFDLPSFHFDVGARQAPPCF
ncbi:hypothetical protein WJX74_007440 [Apatococcus lobatus]|uniref:Uncharacterized protein n=1 Tax=Apatococcus lobatus TaxID=904363 RepID=A0AAW1RTS9_9CHLO